MKTEISFCSITFLWTSVLGALCFFPVVSQAQAAQGIIETVIGQNINQWSLMRDLRLEFNAWADFGATYNARHPKGNDNFPITFNDRTGKFQGNQLYLFLERALNQDSPHWDLGGRIDFLFGNDARFTQSNGLDDEWLRDKALNEYDVAMPQVYAEIYAPWGKGLNTKIGHFYTLIGYEVVTAPDNFFYSHAYTMQYGEPFTHTGVLFEYPPDDNWTIHAGAVMGWDNSEKLDNWNFIGNVAWANDDASTSLSLSLVTGDVDSHTPDNRTMYSIVLLHDWTEELHYVFQHDFGFQEKGAANGHHAKWYGINQYLFYDIDETIQTGLRFEWFRDADDSRVGIGDGADFFALTVGTNWYPFPWLTLRPELRYDWVVSSSDAFDAGTRNSQFTLATDIIIRF